MDKYRISWFYLCFSRHLGCHTLISIWKCAWRTKGVAGIIKRWLGSQVFGKLSKTGQPTIATWVSGGIALLAVLLGGLNTVAQFVSILFLTLYVMVNLSAVFEKFVGDPFFRPTLRVPWWISLLGAFGALFVMFLISPVACLFAILFELLLYYFLSRRKLQKVWGDARAGFWFVLARFALLRHRPHGRKPRSWRPSIMVFSGDTGKRLNLVRLACRFSYRSGVVTANKIILGDLANENHDPVAERKQMRQDIQDAGLSAFSEVSVVKEFEHGVIDIAQANGIAGFKSNTILLGWSEKEDRMVSYLRIMKAISKKSVSTIIAKLNWKHVPGTQRRIDLWWGGQQRNGDLMLLLAHQLRSQDPFRDALITVRSVVESEEEKLRIEESYQKSIPKTRIKVNVDVVCRVMGKK